MLKRISLYRVFIRKEENFLNVSEVSNITHDFVSHNVLLKFHIVSRT